MNVVAEAPAPASSTAVRRTAAVQARAVVRRYRSGRGVGPIDLCVFEGETLALMGRNGCGKTTLLRVLATVSRPQNGEVRWFGGGAAAGRATRPGAGRRARGPRPDGTPGDPFLVQNGVIDVHRGRGTRLGGGCARSVARWSS